MVHMAGYTILLGRVRGDVRIRSQANDLHHGLHPDTERRPVEAQ